MAQAPHASSVSRGKRKPKTDSKGRGRKRTYSIGDSDRVDLPCSPPRVQLVLFSATSPTVSSARETDGRQMRSLREKSEKKGGKRF